MCCATVTERWGCIINIAIQRAPRISLLLRLCVILSKMKLPEQEEFETSNAQENVPVEELDSSLGPSPSLDGPSDTDSRGFGISKDPLLFIQLNELLGWPQALEWRETGR